MNPLLVTVILVILSLGCAIVLFRFMKSTAIIKSKLGMFSGSLAGFIVIFYLSKSFYVSISPNPGLITLQVPENYKSYVSNDYKIGFNYPKKYELERDPYAQIVLGIIDLPETHGKIRVFVNRTDIDKDYFNMLKVDMNSKTIKKELAETLENMGIKAYEVLDTSNEMIDGCEALKERLKCNYVIKGRTVPAYFYQTYIYNKPKNLMYVCGMYTRADYDSVNFEVYKNLVASFRVFDR